MSMSLGKLFFNSTVVLLLVSAYDNLPTIYLYLSIFIHKYYYFYSSTIYLTVFLL